MPLNERRAPRVERLLRHALLAGGAFFFLLPLIWMLATSLRSGEEALRKPDTVGEAVFPHGYEASVDSRVVPVKRERILRPSPEEPLVVVRVLEPFRAGDPFCTHVPAPDAPRQVFTEAEVRHLNREIPAGVKMLVEKGNVFDERTGTLKFLSGRAARAKLLWRLSRPVEAGAPPLWLVREWRPEDTNVKETGAAAADPERPWDVARESDIRRVVRPVWRNYPAALQNLHFFSALCNTLFVCALAVTGTVISSVLVAYGLSFYPFRGRKILFGVMLATLMIPYPVTMVPLYLLFRDFGWIGSFKPLWIPAWFGSAFFIFMLRQFFMGLPRDLLNAARMDGCSELEVLWHVVVPLSKPAIAMVALFTFLGTWKDFLALLLYLGNESHSTLSLSLHGLFSEQGSTPWHLVMAAATVFSLPLIVLFFLATKTFIRGMATTGLKE